MYSFWHNCIFISLLFHYWLLVLGSKGQHQANIYKNLKILVYIVYIRHIYGIPFTFISLFLARQPPAGQGFLIHEVSRSHTTTLHSRYDSSGRVISPTQRHLPDNDTTLTTDKRPLPRWDSNPQSQQVSPTQRHLPDNKQNTTTDKRPLPRWDSNPQSQQVSGRRPTP